MHALPDVVDGVCIDVNVVDIVVVESIVNKILLIIINIHVIMNVV